MKVLSILIDVNCFLPNPTGPLGRQWWIFTSWDQSLKSWFLCTIIVYTNFSAQSDLQIVRGSCGMYWFSLSDNGLEGKLKVRHITFFPTCGWKDFGSKSLSKLLLLNDDEAAYFGAPIQAFGRIVIEEEVELSFSLDTSYMSKLTTYGFSLEFL